MRMHLLRVALLPALLLLGTSGSAQVAVPAGCNIVGSTPDYFGCYPNYANSPLPVISTSAVTPVPAGNPVVAEPYATDNATNVFVVNPNPLPAGSLTEFQTYVQTTAGLSAMPSVGLTFNAYVLRPLAGGGYQIVFDSGPLVVPSPASDQVASYALGVPFPVQAGDLIAHYGQGIPINIGTGSDLTFYPATQPAPGQTVDLATTPGPLLAQARTYSIGAVVNVGGVTTISGGLRKFVDPLPNLPIAVADTTTFPGSDYYEIELREYTQKMHSDLPATKLRGYAQVKNGADVAPIAYLGPVIVAQRDRPVRMKFTNKLPAGSGGDLFIPVDTTYMGAGMGPDGTAYTQNRASTHLHGGATPWISDGTPHQWMTPVGETASLKKGVSQRNVPDMWFDAAGAVITDCAGQTTCAVAGATNDPGQGSMTFYYTNQQSARLMFYHDHAYGITRLNVYAGMAAGYLITDATEDALIAGGTLPGLGIPLVIQDKTFVPDNTAPFTNSLGTFPSQLYAQDPTWDTTKWGGFGQLWFPHVYMPNQNPEDITGANAMGRWDYGPWFWPPFTGLVYGPVANPYFGQPGEPQFMPGTPEARAISPSGVPESFMDTPLVNGMAYPKIEVPAAPVRFRILNAANDRFWNLSLFVAADKNSPTTAGTTGAVLCDGSNSAQNVADCTEVKMVPFNSSQNAIAPFPASWYTVNVNGFTFDDRAGGVPDPATRGPAMIQIATEGGFLPAPAVINNQPVNYTYNRRDIVVLNVQEKALFLGPAERADIIVDFTPFAGKTLILYNDAPAPVPASDPRLDNYTGAPDQSDTGGPPSTLPGYGPNTRTIMQIQVAGSGGAGGADYVNPTILANLQAALPAAFAASQEPIIVPQQAYDGVYGTTTTDTAGKNFATIQTTNMTFTPIGQTELTMDMAPKAIIEDFQMDYGRMNAILGVEVPHTNNTNQTSILQAYIDPPTELIRITAAGNATPIGEAADGTQIWKITHNGVDTHAIHFHLFHVQLVNRVGWDGAIRKPDPNELGWKDTVRMNPLEDIIVALRPRTLTVPFRLENSIRPLDPTMPLGSATGFTGVDPNGNPVALVNQLVNFGWEYVWHCHLLGHEENDMMRALAVAAPPEDPTGLTAALTGNGNNKRTLLAWVDNSLNETGFTIQRATDLAFTAVTTFTVGPNVTTYTDVIGNTNQTYYYRVLASNTVGAAVGGYSQLTATSGASNTAGVNLPPAAPTNVAVSGATLTQGRARFTITWTDNANNESGFRVQWATDAAFTTGVGTTTVGANSTSALTPGSGTSRLFQNTPYYFRVQAYNASGTSAWVTFTGNPVTVP